ncbi:hypothetical protein FSP39_004377 [Pinctada imbricata]|uniref:G-protein coupled receptors family 2 profile 2 domain-containing protein n=1 Tax=Pinctada imbricata TaxID=66713 RepID=A0AA89BYF4_PINIB|nr:hypothetical protein FSP39_004377 [Pinctada imbricata]
MKHLPMKFLLATLVVLLHHQLWKDCRSVTVVESIIMYHTHVNHTFVLEQYIAVCGHDFLCDVSVVPPHLKSNNSYESHIKCPPCSCNISCLVNWNCCPDLYLTLPPMTCETVDLEGFERNETENFRIVSSCPNDTIQEQIEACEVRNLSIIDRLFLPPVTSDGNLSIAFKNRHCAACNGFIAESEWIFNISCSQPTDFNYFSSYSEILNRASERNCHLSFYPINEEYAYKCEYRKVRDDMYYNTCRWTDYWQDSDNGDIQKMCESDYDLELELENSGITFKNVFCYICNAPYYDDNAIETCNSTDVWKPYDEKLFNACQYYPTITAVYPFKNIFCKLCNTNMENSLYFNDAEVTFTQGQFPFQYNITVEHFSFEYFYKVYLDIYSSTEYEDYEYIDVFQEFNSAYDVNLNSLLEQIHPYSPKRICHHSLKEPFATTLSEELNVRVLQQICYDYRVAYPMECLSTLLMMDHASPRHPRESEPVEERKVPLIIDCYRDSLPDLAMRTVPYCDQYLTDSIFTYLPVMKTKGDFNRFLFTSVFCALCNIDEDEVISIMSSNHMHYIEDTLYDFLRFLNIFKITLFCSLHLNFHNHVFLHSAIQTAYSMGCEVRYEPPPESDASCDIQDYDVGYCNSTGLWWEYDEDVVSACEYIELPWTLPVQKIQNVTYRNEFCILCNPLYSETNVIDSCSITGHLDLACEEGPVIQASYPYKNAFCMMCNLGIGIIVTETLASYTTTPTPFPPTNPSPTDSLPSLRSVFSIQQYDWGSQQTNYQSCNDHQFYDSLQGVCRNKTCYPGKILIGSNCSSLLTVTNNLRYAITMRHKGMVSGVLTIQDISTVYNFTLKDHLADIFRTSDFVIETMFSLYNISCDAEINNTNANVYIDLLTYVKVFVFGDVQRLLVEIDMVSFMNTELNITLDDGVLHLQNSFNRHASHIDGILHEYDQSQVCYVHMSSPPITNASSDDFRTVHISNLLICVQTIFKKYEYRLDWDGLTLYLVNLGLKLYYEEFQILPNGMVTVCLDRVLTAIHTASATQISVLRVLTTVCVTVSVICLLLTLLTYALFPHLRTIPGKNNIVLIVTLLMAQIVLLIQPIVTEVESLCIVIGSFSHYAWLCYFASLISCSVHMFRVFTGLHLHYEDNANKTVAKYTAFTFGIPAIIVVSVLSITMATTDGQSWGYSTYNCFIKEKYVYISTFITPLVVACSCNLVCLIVTANKIRVVPKIQKNKPDQVHFIVYLKLFVLTGMTWTFQIVDAFLMESVLTYISTFLNGCQGLLIFLTYVCNKRVLTLYKQLLLGERSDDEFHSSESRDSRAYEKTATTHM